MLYQGLASRVMRSASTPGGVVFQSATVWLLSNTRGGIAKSKNSRHDLGQCTHRHNNGSSSTNCVTAGGLTSHQIPTTSRGARWFRLCARNAVSTESGNYRDRTPRRWAQTKTRSSRELVRFRSVLNELHQLDHCLGVLSEWYAFSVLTAFRVQNIYHSVTLRFRS